MQVQILAVLFTRCWAGESGVSTLKENSRRQAKESGTSEERREAQEDWSRAWEWVMGNEAGKSVCVRHFWATDFF